MPPFSKNFVRSLKYLIQTIIFTSNNCVAPEQLRPSSSPSLRGGEWRYEKATTWYSQIKLEKLSQYYTLMIWCSINTITLGYFQDKCVHTVICNKLTRRAMKTWYNRHFLNIIKKIGCNLTGFYAILGKTLISELTHEYGSCFKEMGILLSDIMLISSIKTSIKQCSGLRVGDYLFTVTLRHIMKGTYWKW